MADAPYLAAHVSEIPPAADPEPGSYEWKPIRHHFDVRSFGVNLFVAANAGDWVIEEHTETEESGTRHEELFFVSDGHARFHVGGDEVDAPAGTFVFVPDPGTRRGARAVEGGTAVLAIGGEPGVGYTVSPWERTHFE
jgi:hypothetical protein